jgi:hypothetical protein
VEESEVERVGMEGDDEDDEDGRNRNEREEIKGHEGDHHCYKNTPPCFSFETTTPGAMLLFLYLFMRDIMEFGARGGPMY